MESTLRSLPALPQALPGTRGLLVKVARIFSRDRDLGSASGETPGCTASPATAAPAPAQPPGNSSSGLLGGRGEGCWALCAALVLPPVSFQPLEAKPPIPPEGPGLPGRGTISWAFVSSRVGGSGETESWCLMGCAAGPTQVALSSLWAPEGSNHQMCGPAGTATRCTPRMESPWSQPCGID